MANPIVINNGPLDCTNPGIARGAIEAFDADVGFLGWRHKIAEVVGDTGNSSTIHQDDIRVRVKDCAVSRGRGSIATMRLGTSNSHGGCGVGPQHCRTATWSGYAMNKTLRQARSDLLMPPFNGDKRSQQVDSHVVKRAIGVFEPRLKPLKARRELALRDIRIGHGFHLKFSENPDHNLEAHQRFCELHTHEG
jgi:hypothetical protein